MLSRHCACGIAFCNRRVSRLCVTASVSSRCTPNRRILDRTCSDSRLVNWVEGKIKSIFAGYLAQVLSLSVKLATFRLTHTTVPWLVFPCHINFYVQIGRHEHTCSLHQLNFAIKPVKNMATRDVFAASHGTGFDSLNTHHMCRPVMVISLWTCWAFSMCRFCFFGMSWHEKIKSCNLNKVFLIFHSESPKTMKG